MVLDEIGPASVFFVRTGKTLDQAPNFLEECVKSYFPQQRIIDFFVFYEEKSVSAGQWSALCLRCLHVGLFCTVLYINHPILGCKIYERLLVWTVWWQT